MTSSPLLQIALSVLYRECFAPFETRICEGSKRRLLSRLNLSAIARRSSGILALCVYEVKLSSMAFFAASLMWKGVGKSGSPAVSVTTSTPSA